MTALLAVLLAMEPLHLTLIHTGEFYSEYDGTRAWFFNPEFPPPIGGLRALGDLINHTRKRTQHLLLLDSGNFAAGDLFGEGSRIQDAVSFLRQHPYTALNVGFRDLALGPDRLRLLRASIPSPLLSANLRMADGTRPPFIQAETLIVVDGVPIGIFGLTSEYFRIYNLWEKMDEWKVEREIPAAREAVRRLRAQGAKLIICLSNTGFAHERRLAREVPEIDVILGSLDPPGLREPVVEGPRHTLIVRPYSGGTQAGVLELWVDRNVGGVVNYRYESVALLWEDYPGTPAVSFPLPQPEDEEEFFAFPEGTTIPEAPLEP